MHDRIWPELNELPKNTVTPPQYSYRQLARSDVERLTERVKAWHPDVSVGQGKVFSDPDYYLQNVSLAGEPDKHTIVYVGVHEGEMICAMCIEINPANRTLFNKFGVCAPEHRGTGATLFAGYAIDALASKLDIAMAWGYVTTKSRGMQQMMERAGFNPVGVVQFSDIELNQHDEPQHVTEAIYTKHYERASLLEPLLKSNLTPQMQALCKALGIAYTE
ncbi:hypothetical protein [Pseudomonas sp.]|uniref:hypothetical protein n=1 Tax=Pseudomonas sp. TaxID=306 RepID=UPI003C75DF41